MMLNNLIHYFQNNAHNIFILTCQHIYMAGLSLVIAMMIGIPTGILISRNKVLADKILAVANLLMTIPSIALFGLMLPVLSIWGLGLGMFPAVVALIVYSQLPIIRSTYTAIINLDKTILDAGKGIGLSSKRLLWEVEIPLALPTIIKGVHTAAIMNIGIAAIATYIGAGGLGNLIQQGISRTYLTMILAGVVGVSALAIITDILFIYLEKIITPKGIRVK